MALWEIVNPSDYATLEADDLMTADIVATVLGGGQYCAKEIDGERSTPIYLFGGSTARKAWWAENSPDMTEDAYVKANERALADAFDSVALGNRTDLDAALAEISDADKRREFVKKWNERKRSSMNNIAGRAHKIAEQLREKMAAGTDAGSSSASQISGMTDR